MKRLFQPLDPFLAIEIKRRDLPHWRQEGGTYFVTFRTADSLPAKKVRMLKMQIEMLRRSRLKTTAGSIRGKDLVFKRFDYWLDQGTGACHLRDFRCSEIVESALRFFDLDRYSLDEFAVMPNHVHTLVKPWAPSKLEKILHSWKSFTAGKINQYLGRRGGFWFPESFDRIVRDEGELERIRTYIRENPIRAGLQEGEFAQGMGSGIVTGWR